MYIIKEAVGSMWVTPSWVAKDKIKEREETTTKKEDCHG